MPDISRAKDPKRQRMECRMTHQRERMAVLDTYDSLADESNGLMLFRLKCLARTCHANTDHLPVSTAGVPHCDDHRFEFR